jgi:acyl dehydratase
VSILTDYGRAIAATVPVLDRLPFLPGGGGPLPAITRQRDDVAIERDHLAAYAKLCGFTLRDRLPATYLNVLAFPVHISLMTDPKMPFGPVGLVHIFNAISQRRPVSPSETLSLRVSISGLDPHPKGQTLTLHSEWRAGDELVWSGASTMLRRGKGDPDAAAPTVDVPDDIAPTATWKLPADLGRRYAAISGDRNPIHLYDVTAKAFGFPRAIAHGLWTKARCVAEFDADPPDAFDVAVRFRAPILLPSTVTFGARDGLFSVRNAKSGAPHLDGTITERTVLT